MRRLPHRGQNLLLLAASYLFYSFWNPRCLILIAASTLINYALGIAIHRTDRERTGRWLVGICVASNLGILGFYKYFNFFIESFSDILSGLGIPITYPALEILLPLGISFFTFKGMSYPIDVYRGTVEPTRNPIDFALFIAFFPHLGAGPIERADNLLGQISRPREKSSEMVKEGCFLFMLGLFKKVFVADNLARLADPVFSSSSPPEGITVLIATYAFTFQIYCDFSGYTDMARGISKILGFDTILNFDRPYFARNPREFWRRWHISLSTWLRDYLYIPLGGSRRGEPRVLYNLMITMILGGLWHGANWTFVLWGFYHGLLLCVHRTWSRLRAGRPGSLLKNLLSGLIWFQFAALGWMFFRANSFTQIREMVFALFTDFTIPDGLLPRIGRLLFFIAPLFGVEIWQEIKGDELIPMRQRRIIQVALFVVTFYLLILFNSGGQDYIYFQF